MKFCVVYRLNVMIHEWGRPLVPWYVANYHGICHLIPSGKIFSHSVSVCVKCLYLLHQITCLTFNKIWQFLLSAVQQWEHTREDYILVYFLNKEQIIWDWELFKYILIFIILDVIIFFSISKINCWNIASKWGTDICSLL